MLREFAPLAIHLCVHRKPRHAHAERQILAQADEIECASGRQVEDEAGGGDPVRGRPIAVGRAVEDLGGRETRAARMAGGGDGALGKVAREGGGLRGAE